MNNYFSHDSNARNSDKLIPLRARMGAEGYGIYFMLLERLREEPGYMSVKDYNMLAFDLRVDAAKVKSVIEDFGLFVFTECGKYFYSESFNRRMQVKDEKSEKAKTTAYKKWGISSSEDKKNSVKRSERLSAARKIATHTKDEWEELKSFFGHCVICGKSSSEVQLVKDHIKPIYQGGSDGISNLQPLCGSCNSRKGPDATDYRLGFCERNGIEMPAKWLQNACKTPAIKVKESKGNIIPPTKVVPPLKGENHPPDDAENAEDSGNKAGNSGVTLSKTEEKEKSCAKKEKEFQNQLALYVPTYGERMILEFFNYWSEWNKSRTKMRFELEKTWDLSRRLQTWDRRDKTWKNGFAKQDTNNRRRGTEVTATCAEDYQTTF